MFASRRHVCCAATVVEAELSSRPVCRRLTTGLRSHVTGLNRSPGLPPRFARVLGRQVAAGEPVTAQRRNPAQRAGWSIPGFMHTWFCVTQLRQVALL